MTIHNCLPGPLKSHHSNAEYLCYNRTAFPDHILDEFIIQNARAFPSRRAARDRQQTAVEVSLCQEAERLSGSTHFMTPPAKGVHHPVRWPAAASMSLVHWLQVWTGV